MNRKTFFLKLLLVAGIIFAGAGININAQSMQPIPADQAAKREQMYLSTVRVGNVIVRPPILDLYAICTGGAKDSAALIDINKDGYPDIMRFYGGAVANKQQWSKLGPTLLAPLRRLAEMRAQTQVAKKIAVYIAVKDSSNESFSSSSTLDGLATQINQDVLHSASTQASAYIRGAQVTDVKVVSLGPEQGICVVVRYDVPLDQNGLMPQQYVGQGTSTTYEQSPPTPEEGGGYTLPPAGVSSSH